MKTIYQGSVKRVYKTNGDLSEYKYALGDKYNPTDLNKDILLAETHSVEFVLDKSNDSFKLSIIGERFEIIFNNKGEEISSDYY